MFVGEKLTDIRLLHGYSRKELANLLDVSEQSIWQYENNYNGPRLELVNKLKDLFNVKTKYFYDERFYRTDIDPNLLAFRSKQINSVAKTRYEAKHLELMEGLIVLLENYIKYPENNLSSIRDYSIQFICKESERFERDDIIQHIAEYARKNLHIGDDNQKLLFSLEKNGAFIIEKYLGTEIDAYSTWSNSDRPIIMLGTAKKSSVRRNFDIAHELGHLMLHNKMDLSELTKSEYKQIEAEANDFAAYFLMPKQDFCKDMQKIQRVSNPNAYIDLKEKWKVSITAMANYARKLGYLTYEQHRYFYASINRQNFTQVEPLDDVIKIVRPGKMKSSLQFLFDKELITLEKLINMTSYNEKLIAKIVGLEESFLAPYMEKPVFFGVSYISEKGNRDTKSS